MISLKGQEEVNTRTISQGKLMINYEKENKYIMVLRGERELL